MSEHQEQAALIDWAKLYEPQYPELGLLFAVPNGAKLPYIKGANGKRYSPEAMKLKAEGLRSGVPDLVLPCARNGWHGLFIELKYRDNTPSVFQASWLDRLTEQGYLAVACWGWTEARDVIVEYLGMQI
jgi:hypothetical protein